MTDIEKLVEIVVREVLKEIVNRGGELNLQGLTGCPCSSSTVIDMNRYRTPLLTESRLLEVSTSEVVVPAGTVVTPGAREVIKKRKIKLVYKSN
jgi:hypothetical protein